MFPIKTKRPNSLRRRSTAATENYETLEPRSLLAGVVHVDMVGNNLHIDGDGLSNSFSVDLGASTTEGLVQGQDGTQIRFSKDFDSGVNLSRLRDVVIDTSHGHDNVTITNRGDVDVRRLTVLLGFGNDSLYIAGDQDHKFQVNDNLRVLGLYGHDSIFVSHATINDDAFIYAGTGRDAIAFDNVHVADRTWVYGQYGHDTFLVNQSSFGDDVWFDGGGGADLYESVDSRYRDQFRMYGQQGWDWCMLNSSNTVEGRNVIRTTERTPQLANEAGRASAAVTQVKNAFFEFGSQLDRTTADLVQDGLSSLGTAYPTDLVALDLNPITQTVSVTDPTPTISVLWDQAVQEAVAETGVGPTIASRAYAMMHTAMFDAWSAYDPAARSTQLGDTLQRPASENTDGNKLEAMSYAAHRVLDELFADQSNIFDDLMRELGYNPSNATLNVAQPAGIGNRMASALLEFRRTDGANQLGDDTDGILGAPYSDTTGYQPMNPVGVPTIMDAWTPERVPIETGGSTQSFLTPQWGEVVPFGLESSDQFLPDAPQPFLLVDGTLDLDAKTITLADQTVVPIDRSIIGSIINPGFIEQAEEVVEYSANLTDDQKLIAEFWEDGGGTSFPPGTFMTFGQFVSARDNHSVDEDAKMFFALSNAVFDAGVATWQAKVHYDYVRPVRAIRALGELGLIGSFHSSLGGYAIDAWTPNAGTQTILASDFLTYQTPGSDPSPPFSEYTSGHSAFSAAGAEILKRFTGSDTFGASVTFEPGESRFEPGLTPSSSVTLAWDTFSAAADEAGISRLYGGIHFAEGDVNGRQLGASVGEVVWNRAQTFINGA